MAQQPNGDRFDELLADGLTICEAGFGELGNTLPERIRYMSSVMLFESGRLRFFLTDLGSTCVSVVVAAPDPRTLPATMSRETQRWVLTNTTRDVWGQVLDVAVHDYFVDPSAPQDRRASRFDTILRGSDATALPNCFTPPIPHFDQKGRPQLRIALGGFYENHVLGALSDGSARVPDFIFLEDSEAANPRALQRLSSEPVIERAA